MRANRRLELALDQGHAEYNSYNGSRRGIYKPRYLEMRRLLNSFETTAPRAANTSCEADPSSVFPFLYLG